MTVDLAIRPFLRRILGYSDASTIAVDRAECSLQLAASRHSTLVLCGEGDLVPVAAALHRRTLGPDAPFIVCDPRRGNTAATVRSPANRSTGIEAIVAANGGTMCMRAKRLPRDFALLLDGLRHPAGDVRTSVCWGKYNDHDPLLIAPAPIVVPALRDRLDELPQVVDEYADEAVAQLLAPAGCFTAGDRILALTHADTLDELEKTTRRLVALRMSRNTSAAAARLAMAPVSLARWAARRQLRGLVLPR